MWGQLSLPWRQCSWSLFNFLSPRTPLSFLQVCSLSTQSPAPSAAILLSTMLSFYQLIFPVCLCLLKCNSVLRSFILEYWLPLISVHTQNLLSINFHYSSCHWERVFSPLLILEERLFWLLIVLLSHALGAVVQPNYLPALNPTYTHISSAGLWVAVVDRKMAENQL